MYFSYEPNWPPPTKLSVRHLAPATSHEYPNTPSLASFEQSALAPFGKPPPLDCLLMVQNQSPLSGLLEFDPTSAAAGHGNSVALPSDLSKVYPK